MTQKYQSVPVILDFIETVQDNFALHFTEGAYFSQSTLRAVDRQILRLDQAELASHVGDTFGIYYNPRSGQITYRQESAVKSSVCSDVYVGGFIVKNACTLSFLIDQENCPRYLRAFTDAFNDGYLKDAQAKLADLCRYGCTRFSIAFNRDFSKGCEITYDPIKDCDTQNDTDLFHRDLDVQVPCRVLTPTP